MQYLFNHNRCRDALINYESFVMDYCLFVMEVVSKSLDITQLLNKLPIAVIIPVLRVFILLPVTDNCPNYWNQGQEENSYTLYEIMLPDRGLNS